MPPFPESAAETQLKLMRRLLRLTFRLSAGAALLPMSANFQHGCWGRALIDGGEFAALAPGYFVSA